ncbi:hypothetical protein E4U55_000528, partial [Claviceps digitariae]
VYRKSKLDGVCMITELGTPQSVSEARDLASLKDTNPSIEDVIEESPTAKQESECPTEKAGADDAKKLLGDRTEVVFDKSLRGVSFTIRPGEHVTICGRTGSGKSTALLALLRMVYIPIGFNYTDSIGHTRLPLSFLRKGFFVISKDTLKESVPLRQQLDTKGRIFRRENLRRAHAMSPMAKNQLGRRRNRLSGHGNEALGRRDATAVPGEDVAPCGGEAGRCAGA